MSNDFDSPELPDVDINSRLVGGGFEKDFMDVMQKTNAHRPTREVPPLHPTVNISEEEARESANAKHDRSLFPNADGKKMRCEVGVYNLQDEKQRSEYQNMVNNCLQKGWLLARDDWQRTPEGGAFAAVKVLIPEKSRRQKEKDKADEQEQK